MFSVRIIDAAKKLGMKVELVKDGATLLQRLGTHPEVVIFDLNYASADPVGLIRRMKLDDEQKQIETIGFVSHVQVDLRQQAEDAGCDIVLARSAFADKLPALLARYAPAETTPLN